MLSIVGILIFGSILIASRLTSSDPDPQQGAVSGTPAATANPNATPDPNETPGIVVSDPNATHAPDATETVDLGDVTTNKDVAEAFVRVWSAGNYDQLYDLISEQSQAAISREAFIDRYEDIAIEMGTIKLDAEVTSGANDDELFPMKIVIDSSRVGTINDENLLPITNSSGDPRVDWSPNLILSQLSGGYVQWTSQIPQRGRILDRKGRPLAQMGQILRVGVVPGRVQNEADLLAQLSDKLDMPQELIKARYSGGNDDWFMPIKDLPGETDQAVVDQFTAIPGVAIQRPPARIYPQGPLTAHVVGYMSEVTAEELPELSKQGYESGDLVGRTGIEASAEQLLSGKRGGVLAIIGPEGRTIRVLGEVPMENANDIILTLDIDLQKAAFEAMGDEIGATVVLDPNNGEVLAMVSTPSFDPNQFVLGVSDEQWAALMDPVRQPLLNRAVAFGTSTGSIFKVITASAGMAHLGLTENSSTPCPGEFRLDGVDQVWRDWVPGGQGEMNLHNAIVRSCNTVFYRMGAELDEMDENLLPDMAKAYGLGALTGLPELYEIPGIVPDPDWKLANTGDFWARGDAINLAIGQGYLVATPLQMANAYAAIANGGTLYQPHLLLDVVRLDGTVVQSGETVVIRQLPLSGEQVGWLKSALYDVINASNGTATVAFEGVHHQVSGKTGTEETGTDAQGTNAWFAAYTPSDTPKMTNIVFVEKGSAGSKAAAPVSRRIVDAWYVLNP